MAIDIEIDTKAVSDSLVNMLAKIDHFKRVDIGAGLSDFQVEDMHRHRPFTMRSRAKGLATTKIRPHSLREMEHSASHEKRILRYFKSKAKKRRRPPPRAYLRTSTRPILRDEMYARLEERMTRLLADKLHWKQPGD